MAPEVTVHRQTILDAAYAVVRRGGLDTLSARAVAAEMGCSTQPIYRVFGSMEKLREAVCARAVETGLACFQAQDGTYLSSGLGVLRLIAEEPHLFALLTRDAATVRSLVDRQPPHPGILSHMQGLPELAGLGEDQLRRVHTMMWFVAQGVSVLLSLDHSEEALALARSYGSLAGSAIIAWARTAPDQQRR